MVEYVCEVLNFIDFTDTNTNAQQCNKMGNYFQITWLITQSTSLWRIKFTVGIDFKCVDFPRIALRCVSIISFLKDK